MDKKYKGSVYYNKDNVKLFGNIEETAVPLSSKEDDKRNGSVTEYNLKDEDVYILLRKIPEGKVSTYGDLAKALGNPSASRRIGKILAKNRNLVVVPCHRVVKSDGKLGGYILGSDKKKDLLEKEGIRFTNGIINGFSKVRFYPQDNK